MSTARVVVMGGGVVGLEVASRLARRAPDMSVTIVDPDGLHVYQPLLPEVASGRIEPRHAVVPLRAALPDARVLDGQVVSVDDGERTLEVRTIDGSRVHLPFDHLVVAPGSVTRLFPIPGLVDRAVGFQTVAEALHLRDKVLERLQAAEGSTDPDRRARALRFVFVGGGYSGVEAIGELHDMAVAACEEFEDIDRHELGFVLVEATDSILPMVDGRLRRAAIATLEERGVDLRLSTMVESVDDAGVHLSDGSTVAGDVVVWCAGARPNGVVASLGFPVDDDGAVRVDATLAVDGRRGVWSAGDCAAVPDLVNGGTCPGSAQYALRQARQLADNIVAVESGDAPSEFSYRQKGELIALGHGVAVGYVGPFRLTGRVAALLRACLHVARVPTLRRKLRVAVDWTINATFPREITSLGMARDPDRPLEDAERLMEEAS